MNYKKIVGVAAIVFSVMAFGAPMAFAAPPPQIKVSSHRVVLDASDCFQLTVEGRNFVQNSNTWTMVIADGQVIGFGDVFPDGTFSTNSVVICGLSPSSEIVTATTSDGQTASSKIKIAQQK